LGLPIPPDPGGGVTAGLHPGDVSGAGGRKSVPLGSGCGGRDGSGARCLGGTPVPLTPGGHRIADTAPAHQLTRRRRRQSRQQQLRSHQFQFHAVAAPPLPLLCCSSAAALPRTPTVGGSVSVSWSTLAGSVRFDPIRYTTLYIHLYTICDLRFALLFSSFAGLYFFRALPKVSRVLLPPLPFLSRFSTEICTVHKAQKNKQTKNIYAKSEGGETY